jgi:glycosyltransferase involved in cell wall biosynthesis
VEPENPDALAEAIVCLYRDPDLRRALAFVGLQDVEQFEMNRVAARFLAAIAKVAPGLGAGILRTEARNANECAI